MKQKFTSKKKLRRLSWLEIWSLVRSTFKEFFQEKSFLHGAALSYYTIFALVPILYMAFATFGSILGNQKMAAIIGKSLNEYVGITDVSGILSFLNGLDFEKGNFFLNTIGIVVLLISSTALLASLRGSINEFFGIERKFSSQKGRILSHVIARLVSISLLTGIGVIVIVFYFAQTILLSFGQQIFSNNETLSWFMNGVFDNGLAVFSNVVIFTFIFKFLHDGIVQWKLAIAGALVTSVMLYFGQLLIKYYLGNYFFAKDGGIAGTMLILLTWMYYSSQIIFLGAKFTAVYGRFVGKTIHAKS